MRSCFQIICLLVAITAAAYPGSGEEVWIKGKSFYKSLRHKKKSILYFEEWSPYITEFLDDEDYFVAIQLDDSFDPFPEDLLSLPKLTTLAAISDQSIRVAYYDFLERFGRTHGINHMVLPDTMGMSIYERQVIKEANAYSPFYFLCRSFLSYSLPESRQEFVAEVEASPTIWVAVQGENTRKLRKWSQQMKTHQQYGFLEKLRSARSKAYEPVFELDKKLAQALFSSGSLAIDPSKKFPLHNEVISYLGSDQQLKSRLNQYTTVLSYRAKGIPCVVDVRFGGENIEAEDIVIGFDPVKNAETMIQVPNIQVDDSDILLAKMLFGASPIPGRSDLKGARIVKHYGYLGYTDAEYVGLSPNQLQIVDSLANEAIEKWATPGMQIVVVKDGSVVSERCFGYLTYDSLHPVSRNTVYDVASVTKVMATLPAIALLVEQGKINLDDSISMYLEDFSKSNKSGITIRKLLAHHAGLRSYVPFWSMMMEGDRLDAFYYKTPFDEANDIRTYGLEPDPVMLDSLKEFIVRSNLNKDPNTYRYSDLGFMILHLLVEEVTGQPFDQFVADNFYRPMGLKNTGFKPLKNGISPVNIAPTEYDYRYRNYQVWGEVHDRNALVFGGVAGHAGLFSTALDMARMMTMFLHGGYYGGRQYLSSETLDAFNARYFENNRRGLAWDKKGGENNLASGWASDQSFGHTGFTGTMVWADPEEDLIYVFLSNRIYPNADNWKLGTLNTRTKIHDVIYQSIQSAR